MVTDQYENPFGVALTRFSDNVCKSTTQTLRRLDDIVEEQMYSFTLEVICDATIKAQGGGVIMLVDKTDPCSIVVEMKHASGCPTYTASWFVILVH